MARTLDILDLSAMYPKGNSLEHRLRTFPRDGSRPLLTELPESNKRPTVNKKLEVTVYVVEGYWISGTRPFIDIEPVRGALTGVAVADGSCRPYQISGVSVPFSRVSEISPFNVGSPTLVVYTPLAKDERYYKIFFNRVVAEQVIDNATRRELYSSPTGPFEMPASFALPTQSQKELASDLAGWLRENIDTLVLTMPKQPRNIEETDLRCVPPSFRRLCDTFKPCLEKISLTYVTGKGYQKVAKRNR